VCGVWRLTPKWSLWSSQWIYLLYKILAEEGSKRMKFREQTKELNILFNWA